MQPHQHPVVEKMKGILRKLSVESEFGLTNAQLMLINHDLKPGMRTSFPSNFSIDLDFSGTRTSTMGCLEFCGILDRGCFQHCKQINHEAKLQRELIK